MLRLEVGSVNVAGQMPGNVQLAFDERLIDEHLCRDVGQLRITPRGVTGAPALQCLQVITRQRGMSAESIK